MKMRSTGVVLTVLTTLGFPRAVAAQEVTAFTFTVQVEAEKLLPEVTDVAVNCSVTDSNNMVLAEATTWQPVSEGAYSGPITVEVRVADDQLQEMRKAEKYKCMMFLRWPGGDCAPYAGSNDRWQDERCEMRTDRPFETGGALQPLPQS